MTVIRRNRAGHVVFLCQDSRSSVPHQRFCDAWGDLGISVYPLAHISLDYVDSDLVCCGCLDSQAWRKVGPALGLSSVLGEGEMPAGAYTIRSEQVGDRRVLLCLAGDLAGLLYAIEALTQRAAFIAEGLVYEGDDPKTEIPILNYRLLWTWDHSTNWALGYEGQLDWGVMNTYLKPAEAFIDDYIRLIDWASQNRLNGVIIWGFLRDRHGGVPASQTICRYARERGIRVLVGLGTSFYGGFYYRGEHPFSADVWLRRHPEYAARDRAGNPANRLCPSEPANQDWLREGTHWLFDTFDIDGVNLESGDFMVCYCDRCRAQREHMGGDDPDFFKEMCISIGPVIDEILTIRDDAWITFGTYTGFNPGPLPRDMGDPDPTEVLNMANMGGLDPVVVRALPPETIVQWSLTAMINQQPVAMLDFLNEGRPEAMLVSSDWPERLRPPRTHSVGLLHQGSQWYSRGKGHTRYNVELASIKEACLRSAEVGIEGMAITGEASPMYTPVELNYLALGHFSYHPADSLRSFAEKTLSPLVGGVERATEYVTYLAKREAGQMSTTDEADLSERLKHFMSEAEKGGDWHTYRRWRWLSTYRTAQVCDGSAALLPVECTE